MSTIGSIASSGLRAAQLQMDTAAHNVANADTPGFQRQTVALQDQAEDGGVGASVGRAAQAGSDLESDAVDQVASTYSFAANLQMLRTEERMMGALLDTRA